MTTLALMMMTGCATGPRGHDAFGPVPRHYACPPTAAPMTIDGRADEAAWANAPWTEMFIDIQGDHMPRPRFDTRAKMLWDEDALYVYAWMEEPHVWGSLTKHDSIVYHDNDFEIFIDPDGDLENYYEVEVNVLGTIFDLLLVKTYINGGPADHDWSFEGMEYAIDVDGTINDPTDTDRSWTVEFRLPWTGMQPDPGMRIPPQAGDTWRINFSRVQWHHRVSRGEYVKVPKTPEDNWVWSPQGKINMHLPQHWGYLEFTGAP